MPASRGPHRLIACEVDSQLGRTAKPGAARGGVEIGFEAGTLMQVLQCWGRMSDIRRPWVEGRRMARRAGRIE
ncbi:MAG: hypothetical protein WDO56_09845 [Gammaproteobacteria bacterium]